MGLLENVGRSLSKNKSVIAVGFGLALSVIGAAFTARAAIKSKELVDEEKEKQGLEPEENLPVKEVIKVCWKEWVPSVLCYGVSFASILYGKHIDKKSLAAASVTYECLDKFSKEYAEKVKEEIGEEKDNKIREEVRKSIEPNEKNAIASEDYMLYEGDSYFMDVYLNKIFVSNTLKINDAINVYNDKINCDDQVSLNDFYDLIYDRTPCALNRRLCCELGNYMGFDSEDGLIEASYEDTHAVINGKRVPVTKVWFVSKKTAQDIFPKTIM